MFTGALVTGVSYTLIFAGLITTSVHGGLVQKNQRRFSQYNPAAQYGTSSSSINFWGQPPSISENIERMKASVMNPASQYRYGSTQYPYERRIGSMGSSLMDYSPEAIVNSGMDQYPISEEKHLGTLTSRLQDSIVDYAKGAVDAGKNMMNNVVGRASQWLSLLGDDEVQEQRLPPQPKIRPEELTADYWLKGGVASLKENLFKQPIMKKAKNVILFLGDGMSIATVTASRIYSGQKHGEPGEDSELSFDYFPWTGLSRTYCVNSQVADSACSATAYLCGVKANKGTIGVTAAVNYNDCAAMLNTSNHVHSIVAWAQEAGKSTGVVTTTRITHASPAGTYAHVANRLWESDKDVMEGGSDPTKCVDIAKQLVLNEPGRNINVVLGGGLANFLPNSSISGSGRRQGKRKDQVDLIKTWLNDKKTRGLKHAFVSNRKGLLGINRENTDYLLGLFSTSHIPYALNADRERYPTLAEMTKKAIDILSKNEHGYVLFVEGGRIDHALHNNQARRALSETVEFSNAIQQAVDMTSVDDTLIVITSDHAHTMTLNGYPVRGQDVLGIAGYSDYDFLAYTTLSFANGPGYRENNIDGSRHDPETDDLSVPDYKYPAMVPMPVETHGGEDVGIFSRGPWSHLFTGVMEQNVIPLTMGFAACIGPHKKLCREMRNE